MGLFHGHAVQATEGKHLGGASGFHERAVAGEHFHVLARLDRAGRDAAGENAAEIGVGFEDGGEQAERPLLDRGRGHVAHHQIEQGRHALVLGALGRGRHPALLGRAVEQREVELGFAGIEGCEQVEHFVGDLLRAGVGTVHFIDDDDRLQPDLQRLADDELGLRQRAFGRVHQHERRRRPY